MLFCKVITWEFMNLHTKAFFAQMFPRHCGGSLVLGFLGEFDTYGMTLT